MDDVSLGRVVVLASLPVLASCAGVGGQPGTTRDVQAPIVQAIRAADDVFGQHGIPVDEADEFAGRLRSGFFDPRDRWGGLVAGRVTCGTDSAGVDLVHSARTLEMEARVDARRVPGTGGVGTRQEWTEVSVWGSGRADVDGAEHTCSFTSEYREELIRAIAERAERRSVRS